MNLQLEIGRIPTSFYCVSSEEQYGIRMDINFFFPGQKHGRVGFQWKSHPSSIQSHIATISSQKRQ